MPEPLNRRLFLLLKSRFGYVGISSQGDVAKERAVQRGPDGKLKYGSLKKYGEYYLVRCPACHDHKTRLWVSQLFGTKDPVTQQPRIRGFFGCYNENCELDERRASIIEEALTGLHRGVSPYVSDSQDRPEDETFVEVPSLPALPGLCVPVNLLPQTHTALIYLNLRGFDPDYLAHRWSVSLCYETSTILSPWTRKQMVGRIIMPIFMGFKFCGWQARLTRPPAGRHEAKYLTSKYSSKSHLLYGLDLVTKDLLVLVEGPTSVWRYPGIAVATFGKDLSTHQAKLVGQWVGRSRTRKVVLAHDPDVAARTQQRAAEHLNEYVLGRWAPVDMPAGTDPADCDRDVFLNLVAGALTSLGDTSSMSVFNE